MPVEIFSSAEFEAALDSYESAWEYAGTISGERCYRIKISDHADIFIRSSIHGDLSADTGKDSIRVWLCHPGETRAIAKKLQKWTTRLPGWQSRLGILIVKLFNLAQFVQPCQNCHNLTILTEIKNGPNTGKLASFCPRGKDDRTAHPKHTFIIIEEDAEGNFVQATPRQFVQPAQIVQPISPPAPHCPTCNLELRKVTIRNGFNTGKQAYTCPAKLPNGNYANHYFKVIEE